MSKVGLKGVYEYPSGYRAMFWEGPKVRHIGYYEDPREAHYQHLMKQQGHHWVGMPDDLSASFGFIYQITSLETKKMYIGSKQFYLWDGPQGGYKCTDPRDPRWNRKAWRESDWRTYTGSSRKLSEEMARNGVHAYKYEVLQLCSDKLELHMAEIQHQLDRNVLEATDSNGNYLYYNENIASKVFRAPYKVCDMEEARRFSLEAMEEYYLKPELCKKCSTVVPYGINHCPRCGYAG